MSAADSAPETGVLSLGDAKALSGLDLIRGIMAGTVPLPPICAAMDFRFVEAERGRAVVQGNPAFRFYNTLGTVHGGYAGTLMDSCMSTSIQTCLEPGQTYATVEYKVTLVRPLTAETGPIRGEGTVIHLGRSVATAEGRLVDAAGKVYAHGTATCLIFPYPA